MKSIIFALLITLCLPLHATDYQSTESNVNGRNFYTASVSGSAITYTAVSISSGIERKKNYIGTIKGDKVIFDKYGKNDEKLYSLSKKILYSFRQAVGKIYIVNDEMNIKNN